MTSKEEIKKWNADGKLTIGTEVTKKKLLKRELARILLASNAPSQVEEDFQVFARKADVLVERLTIPNEELGMLCKRPFAISVLGLHK